MTKKRGRAKVHRVMSEYAMGDLRSSGGTKVTSRRQAVAIAMSEAGMSKRHRAMHGRAKAT